MNTSDVNAAHTEEAFAQWIETLDRWYNHALVSTPNEATHCIWEGDLEKRDDWLRHGHRLLRSYQGGTQRAHELMDLMQRTNVDPDKVAQQLHYQDWYVVVQLACPKMDDDFFVVVPDDWTHVVWITSESHTDVGGGSMHSYWQDVVGQAMMLSNRWGVHPNNTVWLTHGLELFHLDGDGNYQSSRVTDGHVAHVRALCAKHSWAQTKVAQWVLADVGGSAPWFWAFDEGLSKHPSALLLDTVYSVHESTYGHDRLRKLEELAPTFFADTMRLYAMYTTLFGAPPDEMEAAREYRNARWGWLEQVCQADKPGSSPTSWSMDSVFFEALPSSAV